MRHTLDHVEHTMSSNNTKQRQCWLSVNVGVRTTITHAIVNQKNTYDTEKHCCHLSEFSNMLLQVSKTQPYLLLTAANRKRILATTNASEPGVVCLALAWAQPLAV